MTLNTDSNQADLLDVSKHVEIGENDPEIDRESELAQQNKNLRLLTPIYKIEQNKGKLGAKADTLENEADLTACIDMIYLSILTLEYYASYALGRESIPSSEVIDYLETKVKLMNSELSADERHSIAIYVHNSLCNQAEGYMSFSFPYFDPVKQKTYRHEFRLIRIVDVDSGHLCKITNDGITALLTYINANPKIQDEVTTLLTRKLIRTGRYQLARETAERSRKKVIEYQELISTAIDRVRREAKSGNISKDVIPIIKDSASHIKERLDEEDKTLKSLGELQYEKLDQEAKLLVNKLKETVMSNYSAYKGLYKHIDKKYDELNNISRSLFRPSSGKIPNILNDLLEPLARWKIGDLSNHGDEIISRIMPAQIVSIFDVVTILDQLDTDGDYQSYESPEDIETDIQQIIRIEPSFSEKMIDDCNDHYDKKIRLNKPFTLSQLLEEAEQYNYPEVYQRCLAYVVLLSYADQDSISGSKLGININKNGHFKHRFVTGDNLLISNKE